MGGGKIGIPSPWRLRSLERQRAWREENYPAAEDETGLSRARHIFCGSRWELNFYPGLYDSLRETIFAVPPAEGSAVVNMMNPWVLAINLFLPFQIPTMRPILSDFLSRIWGRRLDVEEIVPGEMESRTTDTGVFWKRVLPVPHITIGCRVPDGRRVDVLALAGGGPDGFQMCAGFTGHIQGRHRNPDRARCMDIRPLLSGDDSLCFLTESGWSGWNGLIPIAGELERQETAYARYKTPYVRRRVACPGTKGRFDLVQALARVSVLRSEGREALVLFLTDSRSSRIRALPPDLAPFRMHGMHHATHQELVRFAEQFSSTNAVREWAQYMRDRYFGFDGGSPLRLNHTAG